MVDYGFSIRNELQYSLVGSDFRNFYMRHTGYYNHPSTSGVIDWWLGWEEPAAADSLIMKNATLIVIQPSTPGRYNFEKIWEKLTSGPPWNDTYDSWYLRFRAYFGARTPMRWAIFSPNFRSDEPTSGYGIEVRKETGEKTFSSDRRYPLKIVKVYSVTHPFATSLWTTVDITVVDADNWFYLDPHTYYYNAGSYHTLGIQKINATTIRLQEVVSSSGIADRFFYVNPIKVVEIKNELKTNTEMYKWIGN